MKIDKIISMANQKVRLRFLAMERSLRATGCQLPLWVIPNLPAIALCSPLNLSKRLPCNPTD
jgi:hypothetical protein